LTHTFECYSPLGCDPFFCSGEAAFHLDPRGSVRCDDTCPDFFNVMSYYSIDPEVALFSPCQLAETEYELFDPRGVRSHVLLGSVLPSGVRFRRGDSNADGHVSLNDCVSTLNYLFRGGSAPACLDTADVNDDGALGLSDAVQLLNHLFRGGPPPAPPAGSCGVDPTDDTLPCEGAAGCSAS
jgi:hypothetical protein